MAEPRSESIPRITGVLEALIGAAVGSFLEPVVGFLSLHFFHSNLPDWIPKGALANLLPAVVLFAVIWLSARWREHRRRRTPGSKGDRISIYVADFGRDRDSQSARDSVVASIRRELGKDQVEVLPAGRRFILAEEVSFEDQATEATKKARALLSRKHGDLLIWGRLHSLGSQDVLELRFVSAAQDGGEGHRFGFIEKLMLELAFGTEMGTALAAVAASLALPAVRDAGRFLANTLVPVASRLARLIRNPPVSMRENDRASLLFSFALIQSSIGEQRGDSSNLRQAVEAYRGALALQTRAPLDWAMTQNNLGNALGAIGERESGTERLEEAVAAYRAALEEWTRERVPLDWAMTQNNLGNVLRALGERESGTERLEEAVAAYRAALEERTRGRVPLDWAMTQNNLGAALQTLGERESGTERLEEAVAAYRAALEECRRERVPLNWAATQNNLGNALKALGERESGTARLEEAVAAYRAAMEERDRERVPLDWAMTQNNLGTALRMLGERESGAGLGFGRLEEAVAAYRAALEEYTRERVPLQWATTQSNLGNALRTLGERESGTARLEEAVAAYRAALEERTRERVPLQWATTQNNLGSALATLGERGSGTGLLREAAEALRAAWEVCREAGTEQYDANFEGRIWEIWKLIAKRS